VPFIESLADPQHSSHFAKKSSSKRLSISPDAAGNTVVSVLKREHKWKR